MKIYGYKNGDSKDLIHMSEVTFQATSDELRELADFFMKSVQQMEASKGKEWNHLHFQDFLDNRSKNDPDVIIDSSE